YRVAMSCPPCRNDAASGAQHLSPGIPLSVFQAARLRGHHSGQADVRGPGAKPGRATSADRRLIARRSRVVAGLRGKDFLTGGIGVLPAIHAHPLAFLQILVVLEEMADALKPMRRDLADVFDVGVARE